ncbi:D-Ala-D-Ala carboxypeptidase family metallohydrolase [Algoriphagus formosus]|uniref:D-Ala-D-Ala carboxypeptidase family metallohydrolase n=1 Tax=Algoriphagus formosus TaxID=2007308 RepID=UPI000C2905C4|nr:D-Ala-D-Ala carboxypeptidase family metallohydrolase [Algoriphagus formosus]
MQLTTNFNLSEFQCRSGAPMPDQVLNHLHSLAMALQIIRNELKAPITITSGYRSPEHNSRIGGAQNSMHIQGKAADFKVYGKNPRAVAAIIERLISEGKIPQGGLKAYRSWVHYDIRGVRARW